MPEIKYNRIVIMGAGAVGGYFGGRLAEKSGADITFIARGRHLEAMRQEGLSIQSIDGDVKLEVMATDRPEEAGEADLVLFTVKSYDTDQAIEQIRPIVSGKTQVLTLQNGIENYPKLAEAFGEERVIQGFCKIGAGVPDPGVVKHKALGEITVGEKDGSQSKRLVRLVKLFGKAGIPAEISGDIEKEVWLKFTWNCLFNMLTAVAMVTVEKLFKHEESIRLCHELFEEIRKVAYAEGVELGREEGRKLIESGKKLEGFETSTYQDRRKGKQLEYEAFTGAVIRIADSNEIEVPAHRTLYALLKLIDN